MDRDETLVAQAFATSSIEVIGRGNAEQARSLLTGTVVVSIKQGKESANCKDVGILIERHAGCGKGQM